VLADTAAQPKDQVIAKIEANVTKSGDNSSDVHTEETEEIFIFEGVDINAR
jgi:hypothetical protein